MAIDERRQAQTRLTLLKAVAKPNRAKLEDAFSKGNE
jgi:hypothetical protein